MHSVLWKSLCGYPWELQVADSMSQDEDWLQSCFNILLCHPGHFSFTEMECSARVGQCFTPEHVPESH